MKAVLQSKRNVLDALLTNYLLLTTGYWLLTTAYYFYDFFIKPLPHFYFPPSILANVDEVTHIANTNPDAAMPAQPPLTEKRKKTMQAICAVLGISGGFATPFLGLLCIIAHALMPNDIAFNRLGTALMIMAIPLLLVGSHFLDKLEEGRNRSSDSAQH